MRQRTPSRFDAVLLAAMVERHPQAEWTHEARATALGFCAQRNELFCFLLTGHDVPSVAA